MTTTKKNQNAPRSSEHPPVRGKTVKTFRWDHRLQIQNFEVAAVTKILGRRDKTIVVPLLSTENCKKSTPNENAHSIYGGDCDKAIAKAAAAVTHVQSQSQETGSGDERLGLFGFDFSSAETYFWWLEDEQ